MFLQFKIKIYFYVCLDMNFVIEKLLKVVRSDGFRYMYLLCSSMDRKTRNRRKKKQSFTWILEGIVEGWIELSRLCALFSVFIAHVIKTKNRNRSINKFKNLGYDRWWQYKQPRRESGLLFLIRALFAEVYPSRWAPTRRPETNRNICHWVLLQKHKFISRGTQKH